MPKEFVPAIERGIRSVAEGGVLAGYPVIDFKVTLIGGANHDIDSSAIGFETAARAAFREAAPKLGIKLLEPIMHVEVSSPEEYIGMVRKDLNTRRSNVTGTDQSGEMCVITMLVPLANFFGYADALNSLTQNRGTFVARFSLYAQVPQAADDPPPFQPAVGMRA